MAEDIRNMASTVGKKEFEKQYQRPDCILLDSQYCSMGRMIGMQACQMTGYEYYDAVILLELIEHKDITIEDVLSYEKKLRFEKIPREQIVNDPMFQKISGYILEAVKIAVSKSACLIHDWGDESILNSLGKTYIKVLTYADDMQTKIERAKLSPLYQNEPVENLPDRIREEDMVRYNLHHARYDTEWADRDSYDICINSETFGKEFSAQILASLMK